MFCSTCLEKPSLILTIVGCGGVGQPLALLLKHHDSVGELRLFNLSCNKGLVLDLSHINTRAKVVGFSGRQNLGQALENADIIIVTASTTQKPHATRESFFETSAGIVKHLAQTMADIAPDACLCIVTNPVNSMVPLASEVLRQKGKLDPRKIFGINAVDQIRASTFTAEVTGMKPERVTVPVICGHSTDTMVPLLSQVEPNIRIPYRDAKAITDRLIKSGPEVAEAKQDKGATLSVAHAAFKFLESLIQGLTGKQDVVQCAVVRSDITEAKYFSSPIVLGRNGIEEVLDLGTLTVFEKEQLAAALPKLQEEIQRGEDYARSCCCC